MKPERFDAFFDAVFAIILTIMVLEFKAPTDTSWRGLFSLIGPLIAYLISFFVLWTTWYSNHLLFRAVTQISYKMYWIMGVNILLLSFLPFMTSWIGEDLFAVIPAVAYMVLNVLSFFSYHLLTEPEAFKYTPKALRPQVHNSWRINLLRILALGIGLVTIWYFPPISLIVLIFFASLHISEHLLNWKRSNNGFIKVE